MGYIYNFSLQLLCIIVLWFSIVKKRELCAKNYKSVGNSLYVFFVVVLAYSLYTGFGGDDQRYRDFVEGGYENYYYSDFFSFEELYVIIAAKTKNFILWKVVVYGCAIFLSCWSVKKLKVDNLLTLFFFALIPFSSYGSTRAVLAYSNFLFGYTFLNQKKIYKQIIGLVIVVISWQAHSSMILPILLTPLTYLKVTKRRFYLLLLLFPVMVVLFNNYYVSFLGSSALENSMAAGKFTEYNEHGEGTDVSTVGGILRFLFGFVIVPPVLLGIKGVYSKTIDEKFHRLCKFSFLMLYVSYVMYFSQLDNITFFNRYFTMIPFYLYIVISRISLERSVTPSIRMFYFRFVLAYALIQLSYYFYCFCMVWVAD